MSAFDRFLTPQFGASDSLASFFRSLAFPIRSYGASSQAATNTTDYDWQRLRSAVGGQSTHLEFFDSSLTGRDGADVVLSALKENRDATSITLAQNEMGDDGLRAFLAGLKQLRGNGIGNRLRELNLSGNLLTDTSLHLIALHLLYPSPHPPSITHLYATANQLALGSTSNSDVLANFLGAAISSPASRLRCLSLTNNPSIGSAGFIALLKALRLSNVSALTQIHLSVCGLDPSCVRPLAEWLEDPEGGAISLQVLCLNGNKLSTPGLKRIARAVTSGRCSGLIHFESFASEEVGPEWDEIVKELEKEEDFAVEKEKMNQKDDEEEMTWRDRTEEAKSRNKRVFRETRLAALGMLAKTRILFSGNAREGTVDLENLNLSDSSTSNDSTEDVVEPFPFLRLPIELQVHVLRCTLLLRPSPDAHLYPPFSSSLTSSSSLSSSPFSSPHSTIQSSPLTERQFLRALEHGANRLTLKTEARYAYRIEDLTQRKNSLGDSGFGGPRSSEDEDGWEKWMLAETGCDRFER